MKHIARATALLPTLLALLAPAPSGAAQSSYTVFTCKLPNGTPAATDGWAAEPTARRFSLSDGCANGGPLSIDMDAASTFTGTDHGWVWTAPAGARVTGVTLNRGYNLAVSTTNPQPGWQVQSGTTVMDESWASTVAGSTVSWSDPRNIVPLPDASLSDRIRAVLGCFGAADDVCDPNGPSRATIHAATFTLADDFAPSTSGFSGTLTTAGDKSGVVNLAFGASDTGSGVYRAIVRVDNDVVATPVLSNPQGTCVDAYTDNGDNDPYQFEARQPCPANVDADLPLDTRLFSDGAHTVAVAVEDAAGNPASVYGPATINIRNATGDPTPTTPPSGNPGAGTPTPGPGTPSGANPSTAPGAPNGSNATPNARMSIASVRRTLRLKYGRTTTIRGRLTTPGGRGIAGAAVRVAARVSLPRRAFARVATVRTDASGAFAYRVPVGPSRLLRLSYSPTVGGQAVERDDVVVRVTSRVDLRLSHKRLRNGQTLRYRGRIRGGYAKGRLAEIQVRVQRRWRVVCVTRARSAGRFGCTYRFRRTFAPTRYTFRAVVRRQAGFPYETGTSPVRRVRVSPR